MSTGTISTRLRESVTLGSRGFPPTLTVTSTGMIYPGLGKIGVFSSLSTGGIYNYGTILASSSGFIGGRPAVGVEITGTAVLVNSGYIGGGTWGYDFGGGNGTTGVYSTGLVENLATGLVVGGDGGFRYGGNGGVGIVLNHNTVVNAGTIIGGSAYSSGGDDYGGAGVLGNGYVSNSGKINGGSGITSAYYPQYHSGGGAGVNFTGGLNNSGIITGGYGLGLVLYSGTRVGYGGIGVAINPNGGTFSNSGTVIGGAGNDAGIGVQLLGTGTLVNQGTFQGGNGYSGGVGLALFGSGTVIDSGIIAGGTINQSTADAIEFGTFADTLIVDPGAVFDGNVVANAAYADMLEVAGSSSVVFGGIGTQFTGFDDIAFASLAVRTIAGDVAGLAAGQTISGFAGHDEIILDGFSAASAALTTSGVELISSGTTAMLDIVLAASKNIVVSETDGNTTLAAPAGTVTLTSGETELTASGGSSHNTRIDGGGTLTVYAGGTASTPIIAGGELILNAGGHFSGAVDFTGTGGLLAIGGTVMPANVISGFVAGDTIQLTSLPYKAGATASVSSPGHVVIHDGPVTEKLNIAGTTLGEPLMFGPGSVLTVGTAQMAFLAPETVAVAREGWFSGSAMMETPLPPPMAVPGTVHFAGGPDLLETVHKGGAQGFVVLPHG